MTGRAKAIQIKQEQLRRDIFGEESGARIWTRDDKGFCSIPRTMTLIMTMFPEITDSKSANPSLAYLDLWCQAWESGMVEIKSESDRAFACGYLPKRALRTWRERMADLEKLGFIETKPKANMKFGYVLLVNPYLVIRKLIDEGKVSEQWEGAIRSRMSEIGAGFPAENETPVRTSRKQKASRKRPGS